MARIREKTLKFPGLDNVYTFADEADLFNANVACAVGEYRIYNGDLYCCTTAHTGAWDASHFKAVKMGNEVSGLKTAISENGTGINLFSSATLANGKGYNVNQNTTTNDSTLVRANMKVNAGDTLEINHYFNTNTFGFNFLNSAGNQLIANAYCDGFHTRVKVPEGAGQTYWTVDKSYQSDFSIKVIPQVKAMAEDIANDRNPFCRKTIKDQLYPLNGFTHCAFPSVALFSGKEVIAFRASKSHLTPQDTANWGGIMLVTRSPDGTWENLGLVDTSGCVFNGELRDPCLTVSRDGTTLFMSCFTTYRDAGAPTTDLHDNVLFTLNENFEVTSYTTIANCSNLFWGNTIVTPEGYLIHAAYHTGTIYLYKTTTTFSGSLENMVFDEPIQIATTTSATECTIGYWDDLLVLLFRRDDNNNARYSVTTNLEGTSGWSSPTSMKTGVFSLHAPVLLPYYSGEYLPFAGAKYDSSSYRYAVSGLIKKGANNSLSVDCVENVDIAQFGYSGYCGLTYFGGDEFAIAYYRESGISHSTLNVNTGMYYKHFHMRELCPKMAYM